MTTPPQNNGTQDAEQKARELMQITAERAQTLRTMIDENALEPFLLNCVVMAFEDAVTHQVEAYDRGDYAGSLVWFDGAFAEGFVPEEEWGLDFERSMVSGHNQARVAERYRHFKKKAQAIAHLHAQATQPDWLINAMCVPLVDHIQGAAQVALEMDDIEGVFASFHFFDAAPERFDPSEYQRP